MLIEILTPEGSKLHRDNVSYVKLPLPDGLIGIAQGRQQAIMQITPGKVYVDAQIVNVGKGFAKIGKTHTGITTIEILVGKADVQHYEAIH